MKLHTMGSRAGVQLPTVDVKIEVLEFGYGYQPSRKLFKKLVGVETGMLMIEDDSICQMTEHDAVQ